MIVTMGLVCFRAMQEYGVLTTIMIGCGNVLTYAMCTSQVGILSCICLDCASMVPAFKILFSALCCSGWELYALHLLMPATNVVVW
jgi:hypothetical protein